MSSLFADLSGWNAAPQAVNWQAYKAWSENGGATSLVALKASEGAGIVDPHYSGYLHGARAAGISSILHYHFARPDLNTAGAEANYAARTIGAIGPQDVILLDMEVSAPQATAAWAFAWLEAIAAHYGRLPGIYASSAYITARLQNMALATYPLWLAAWNNNPNVRPPCPAPWKAYAYWQFTDKYQTPGIGSTDANIALLDEGGPSLVTTHTTPNALTLALAGNYFTQESATAWRCKQNGCVLHDGNLAYYCALDPTHEQGDYYGLSVLGVPITGEASVPGLPGVTLQRFERGIVAYDPDGKLARPVGVKRANYLYPVESLYKALDGLQATSKQQATELDGLKQQLAQAQQDSAALKSQAGTLETRNSQLQSQLTAASTQLHSAQAANETLQANYAALAAEKAALEQQPDTATYQAFVSDVSGASTQLQAALAKVNVPAPSATQGGQGQ